jgi:hypothetical protein
MMTKPTPQIMKATASRLQLPAPSDVWVVVDYSISDVTAEGFGTRSIGRL